MHEGLARTLYAAAARVRGEPVFRYLERFRGMQWMGRAEWDRYRSERLDALVRYTADCIPYYRDRAVRHFRDFPVLGRSDLQQSPADFVNPAIRRGITPKRTSGTTGEPVKVLRDREAMAGEQAVTWRGYEWAGVRPGDRQARFWGVPYDRRQRLLTRCRDWALNRIRLSVFNFDDEVFHAYLRLIRDFRPAFVYGYVSAIEEFARFLESLEASGKRPELPGLKAVITTSEVLSPEARERISRAWGAPVFNEYGCSEMGTIAHECPKGGMHVNSETMHVEVMDDDGTIREEGRGRLLITEFQNRVQPLIRYDLGDLGELERGGCPCGRSMPLLRRIHGRSSDILYGEGGRKFSPEFFNYLFKDLQGGHERIRQYQVVQSDGGFLVNLVKGPDFDATVESGFRQRMLSEFGGNYQFSFQFHERLPRELSGKLRQVKRIAPAAPAAVKTNVPSL